MSQFKFEGAEAQKALLLVSGWVRISDLLTPEPKRFTNEKPNFQEQRACIWKLWEANIAMVRVEYGVW